MNTTLMMTSVLQYAITLAICILVLFITFFILKIFLQRNQVLSNDVNSGILMSSVLLSTAYLISGLASPIGGLLNYSLPAIDSSYIISFQIFIVLLEFTGISLLLTAVNLLIVFLCFYKIAISSKVQKTNENQKIEKVSNNLVISLMIAAIIIGISLTTREGIVQIFESLIPYPSIPMIN